MVSEEDQLSASCRVGHFDSAEFIRVVFGRVEAGEDDGLVALEAGVFIDGVGIAAALTPVGLGPDDEAGGGLLQGVAAAAVQVAALHDVAGAGVGQ